MLASAAAEGQILDDDSEIEDESDAEDEPGTEEEDPFDQYYRKDLLQVVQEAIPHHQVIDVAKSLYVNAYVRDTASTWEECAEISQHRNQLQDRDVMHPLLLGPGQSRCVPRL